MNFIDELKAILDHYGDGPFTEEVRIQRYGEVTNCMSRNLWRPVETPPEIADPLGHLFRSWLKNSDEDERIRRIVREELEKQSKTERRSFGKSLSAIIREIEADLEAPE